MRDGSLAPLFINKKQRIPVGEWLEAENHPTNGFAVRQGWHCTLKPEAPHLSENPKGDVPRIWVTVEVEDYKTYDRPESQGGTWVLAQRMKVIGQYVPRPNATQYGVMNEERFFNNLSTHFERFTD